jgi:DNA-binding NarL/FixJ family response regulator
VDRPVRLAITNDYEVVVRGLASMLEPFADRIEIVDLAAHEPVHTEADVALFDAFGSGEVHTGDVRRVLDDPRVRYVAMYTSNFDPALIETARRMGVAGYLSKALPGEQLADAICRIADGEQVVRDAPARRTTSPRRWPGMLHDLSEAEAEVLALITQGYENSAIARRLYISQNTLKTRIRMMYRRLGFENRVQAAVWAVKHGFETDSGASATSRDEREPVP